MLIKLRNIAMSIRFIRARCISFIANYVSFDTTVYIVRLLSGGRLYPNGYTEPAVIGLKGMYVALFIQRIATAVMVSELKPMFFDMSLSKILNNHFLLTEKTDSYKPTFKEVYQWQWLINAVNDDPVVNAIDLLYFIGAIDKEDRDILRSTADNKLEREVSIFISNMEGHDVSQSVCVEVTEYLQDLCKKKHHFN